MIFDSSRTERSDASLQSHVQKVENPDLSNAANPINSQILPNRDFCISTRSHIVNTPIWLAIIKLFINPRVGQTLYGVVRIGVDAALMTSSAKGYPVLTAFFFCVAYAMA